MERYDVKLKEHFEELEYMAKPSADVTQSSRCNKVVPPSQRAGYIKFCKEKCGMLVTDDRTGNVSKKGQVFAHGSVETIRGRSSYLK
jgi:hypothetical protein